MGQYSEAFEKAMSHCMLYEVGGWWDVNHPAVAQGLIDTRANRTAVGYTVDPTDAGGETKFGVAKNANTDLDITRLGWEQAKAVYFKRYWLAASCNKLNGRVAALHFDGAVNHGVSRANIFLQRAAGVGADGVIGAISLAKISTIDPFVLCASICTQREQYYRAIVANKPAQGKYLNGWLRRIAEMRAFVLDHNTTF